MEKQSIEYNGLKAGALTFAGLMALFFIMKMAGLIHNIELRVLNIFVMFGGILYGIKSLKKVNGEFNFLKGMATGLVTAFSASILFALFIFAYLQFIDPNFMRMLIENEPFGSYMNPFSVACIIAIEGPFSGFWLSFVTMQWHKKQLFRRDYSPENAH